ncbi:MAG: hypothetical protein IPQ25_09960 [Chitinophagaceae bacterium]|nr:hypothetical protein [Chitinophagaceae bacterium]
MNEILQFVSFFPVQFTIDSRLAPKLLVLSPHGCGDITIKSVPGLNMALYSMITSSAYN